MVKYIDELKKEELAGKKVLMRADFDIPVVGGKITETFRVKAQKETLDYLANAGAKVLMVAHLGHEVSNASFAPVVEEIGDILGQTIMLVPHSELGKVDLLFQECPVLLLDNIRQDKREVENDDGLARELTGGGPALSERSESKGFDFYVNNDFAVMHREHASVVAVAKHLPSYAGFLIKKEVENLQKAINVPIEGKILVLGGAKIATKIPVIKNFLNKAEKILIGGALANSFFKAQGIDVGKSLVDDECLDMLAELRTQKDKWNPKIILPKDVMISQSKSDLSPAKPYPVLDIAGHYMLDIGPETAKNYAEIIKKADLVVWNGPMGLFEIENFAEGTRIVARAVASAADSIVGGGDTIAAIGKLDLLEKYGFVSTGGGAMLEFLAGNKLPGLEALSYY